jgi:hypothetical protein
MPVIEGSTFWKSEPQEFRISLGGKIAIYYNYRKGHSRLTVIRCMSRSIMTVTDRVSTFLGVSRSFTRFGLQSRKIAAAARCLLEPGATRSQYGCSAETCFC